jgi:hypothetical protein
MSVTTILKSLDGKRDIRFCHYLQCDHAHSMPRLMWKCVSHPEYQGEAMSKEHLSECFKDTLKLLHVKLNQTDD